MKIIAYFILFMMVTTPSFALSEQEKMTLYEKGISLGCSCGLWDKGDGSKFSIKERIDDQEYKNTVAEIMSRYPDSDREFVFNIYGKGFGVGYFMGYEGDPKCYDY